MTHTEAFLNRLKAFIVTKVAFATIIISLSASIGCKRSSDEVWNDSKTAGRHVKRGAKTMGGKQGTSKQVQSSAEFSENGSRYGQPDDFVAFEDDPDQLKLSMDGSQNILPPQETPGEMGSSIPGIEAFKDPSHDPELSMIFEHVHYDYNSSLIKGDENIRILQRIADYMRSHPNVFIFIEGHCDKRGPSAYNFALGANRSNSARNMLVADGISQDRIFTISYGKERLLFEEDGDDFQNLNRRCQFKVYEK